MLTFVHFYQIRCRLEVEDFIIQRHFTNLLQNISENRKLPKYELNSKNSSSLCMIRQYLKSKDIKIPSWASNKAINSSVAKCLICSSPLEFKRKDNSSIAIKGYRWDQIYCVENQHHFQICILSLLPCERPFKTCHICHSIASVNPGERLRYNFYVLPISNRLILPLFSFPSRSSLPVL